MTTSAPDPVTTTAAHDPRVRLLDIPGGHNIRDLGGIPLADGGCIDCGKVLRGEAPALLGERGVAALVSYGVRHVIDLRSNREREAEGHGALQRYIDSGTVVLHPVPLVTDAGWDVDPVGKDPNADVSLHYLRGLDLGGRTLTAALSAALADAAAGGGTAYVHCAVGKDRTGVVVATLLDAMGAHHDAIVDDYVLTGERFRPVIKALGEDNPRPTYARDLKNPNWDVLAPRPHFMTETLRRLSERGGGAAWFADHGVSDRTLSQWREKLRYRNPAHVAAQNHAHHRA